MKKLLSLLLLLPFLANAQTITTVAGTGPTGMMTGSFAGDGGQATAANLYNPCGVAFDAMGNYYFADVQNNRIRKVTPAGIISTVAGVSSGALTADGVAATASGIGTPQYVAVGPDGFVYYSESYGRVRKIDASGNVWTVAGMHMTFSFAGDGGPATAASLNNPTHFAFDAAGNIFIADWVNNRIRKVNATTGIITTVAGSGTAAHSGDGGPATAAGLSPGGMLFDAAGNMLVCDPSNHRIRKIDASGNISTFAGTGTLGATGDGGTATAATFNFPASMAYDSHNNIFLCDENNHKIRKISTTGIVSTIAGNGTAGFGGDGGPATAAMLQHPCGLAFDTGGKLFVTDLWNNRVRKVTIPASTEPPTFIAVHHIPDVALYPNPAKDVLYINTTASAGSSYSIMDTKGAVSYTGVVSAAANGIPVHGLAPGTYFLTVSDPFGEPRTVTFLKE